MPDVEERKQEGPEPAAAPPVTPRKRKASKRLVMPADRLVGCDGGSTLKACRAIAGKAGDGKWAIVTVLEVIENKTETLVTSKRVKA